MVKVSPAIGTPFKRKAVPLISMGWPGFQVPPAPGRALMGEPHAKVLP